MRTSPQTVQLQSGACSDAADQPGLSRLDGGIHDSVDDLTGRVIGSHCGPAVWSLAQTCFAGSVSSAPLSLTLKPLNQNQPLADDPAGFVLALDSSRAQTNSLPTGNKFYRVIRSFGP